MRVTTTGTTETNKTLGATPSSVSYRYDLDGLRGIAIAFVVIFHIFVGRVSGGVDVFLLLSGYFFLGSQLRYASRANASVNPWWPIWRTIRRLLPALILVLVATAAIGWFMVPQLRRVPIADQFTASLLYYQNWELIWQDADYNVASDLVSPLQHLWSMSVQGQFYLLAIALAMTIIWVRRAGYDLMKFVGPALIAVTVISFAYAWWLSAVDQSLNYYSTWTRMWQLTLGGVLALYAKHIVFPGRLRAVLTWVGLAMVLSTGVIFNGAAVFPGPAALYPVGGAVLIILSGGYGRLSTVLAHRSMRWLGDIAYSLYLWHWPLLIITLLVWEQPEPDLLLGLGTLAVSLVLADVTHRLVEMPLRQHAKRPVHGEARAASAKKELMAGGAPVARAIAGAVLTLALIGMLAGQAFWQARLNAVGGVSLDPVVYPGALALSGAAVPQAEAQPDPALLETMGSKIWGDDCISRFGDDPTLLRVDERGEECMYGDLEADRDVYLTGGSHADQWITPLDELGRENGFRIVPLLRQSCPTFAEERDGVFSEDCISFNEQVIDRLAEADPDLVISTTTRPWVETSGRIEQVPESYLSFWEFLADEGIPFVGLRDNPWRTFPDGSPLSVPLCMMDLEDSDACGLFFDEYYQPIDPSAQYLDPLPNMKAVDTSVWYCADGFCPPIIGNLYVYRDSNHLSNAYTLSLKPLLWEEIREFL
ncbi:acyltransferase [Corynebacterium alimapuense]|uniref:Acyltransferase n=2 Tax=Corynebacterium alimapuense TaxID=1576874 RepID=A0A3M8K7B6_9CORY|nr:acyltransferase [Corynebacterium alimapuense]